jgi:hypothetical protein
VQPNLTSAPSPQISGSVLSIQHSAQTVWLLISVSIIEEALQRKILLTWWDESRDSPALILLHGIICGVLLGQIRHLVWQLTWGNSVPAHYSLLFWMSLLKYKYGCNIPLNVIEQPVCLPMEWFTYMEIGLLLQIQGFLCQSGSTFSIVIWVKSELTIHMSLSNAVHFVGIWWTFVKSM